MEKNGKLLGFALGLWALTALAAAAAERSPGPAEGAGVRVGTYDSRALATAYYRSEAHARRQRQLREEHEKAKADGDAERVEELEARGRALQDQAHKQVFGNAPVEEILEEMKDRIPEIAREAGVDLIVRVWDITWQDPAAEPVDVTDRMVALFFPDEKTLAVIRQIADHPPIPPEELAKMDH